MLMTVAVITSAGLLLLCVIFIAKSALPDEYRWEKVLWDALRKELAKRRKDRSVARKTRGRTAISAGGR